jgi:hypothetical protein
MPKEAQFSQYIDKINGYAFYQVPSDPAIADRSWTDCRRAAIGHTQSSSKPSSAQSSFVLRPLVDTGDSRDFIMSAVGVAQQIVEYATQLIAFCDELKSQEIDKPYKLRQGGTVTVRALAKALEHLVKTNFHNMNSTEVASIILERKGTLNVLTDKKIVAAKYLLVIKSSLWLVPKELSELYVQPASGGTPWCWYQDGKDTFEQALRGAQANPGKESDKVLVSRSKKTNHKETPEDELRRRIKESIMSASSLKFERLSKNGSRFRCVS